MLRNDSLEARLYRFVTDTSKMIIRSNWSEINHVYQYIVTSRQDTLDKVTFSQKQLNLPILHSLDSVYYAAARWYVRLYRKENLDNHVVFFDTQNMGKYISREASGELAFDTARLRSLFRGFLADRGIATHFVFHYSDNDSLLHNVAIPDSLKKQFKVITRAFSTFKNETGKNYVRAMFSSDASYILSKLKWMLAAALLMLLIIAFSLYYLFKSLRREKKLSAIKSDFISNITHELKTPVATVMGAVEALQHFDALSDPAKAGRYLSISQTELKRLSGMIDEILYSSIYESDDFVLRKESFSADEIIGQAIATYKMSPLKHTDFIYTNEAEPGLLNADKLHVMNCISNLVDNAVKYSGDSVTITIRVQDQPGHLIISVGDNGYGISKEYLPMIFEKFFRAPQGNQHRIKGYGLGLSYVKKIMDKHQGACTVESAPGKGTLVKLIFPV